MAARVRWVRSGAWWTPGGRRLDRGEADRLGSLPGISGDAGRAWQGGRGRADFQCADAIAVVGRRGLIIRRVLGRLMMGGSRSVFGHAVTVQRLGGCFSGGQLNSDRISLRQPRAVGGGSFHLACEDERHGQREHDAGERRNHAPNIGALTIGVNLAISHHSPRRAGSVSAPAPSGSGRGRSP